MAEEEEDDDIFGKRRNWRRTRAAYMTPTEQQAASFSPSVSGLKGFGYPSFDGFLGNLGYAGDAPTSSIVSGYGKAARDAYGKQPSTWSLFSNPSKYLDNIFSREATVPGMMLNLLGMPGATGLLEAVAIANRGKIARDHARQRLGVPGYQVGQIGGQPFSVHPGMFGDRVVTGQVPDWFNAYEYDQMQDIMGGSDPEGGALHGFTGTGGLDESGNFVSLSGERWPMHHEDEEFKDTAKNLNLTPGQLKSAIETANKTGKALSLVLGEQYPGATPTLDPSTLGDLDPDFDPASGLEPDINLDPLSEMIDWDAQDEDDMSSTEGTEGFGVGGTDGLGY